MSDWILSFFSSDGFMPHGFCLLWRPDVFWITVLSDGVIALSYFSIPIALVYYAIHRNNIEYRWVLFLFGAFIVACGTTHLLAIWTLWVPDYGLEALAKMVTAVVSLATATILWPLMPKALAAPSQRDLERANASLLRESDLRRNAQHALEALNRDLEGQVTTRTRELEEANRKLRHEVGERQRAERAARDRVHFIERLLETIPTPVFHTDEDSRYTGCNKAFEQFFGVRKDALVGRTAHEVWPEEIAEIYVDADRALLAEGGTHTSEATIQTNDGISHEIEFHRATLYKEEVSHGGVVGVVWDLTERNQAAEQIRFLAYYDPLTELPNRLLARDRMEQAMVQAERAGAKVALLYIDLDNFKAINDTLSHAVGDALLKGVASRLRRCLRTADTISRFGGDEFLCVLPAIANIDDVTAVADRMLNALMNLFAIEGQELSTSASIGAAIYPDDGTDFDTLFRKADMAMYQAKKAGRNGFQFFDRAADIHALENLSLRNGLRLAIERREFVLHYQPQIELATNRVIGVEALIRWNHPELGLLSPGRFIQIAEDSGLIVPIGDWVLQEACRQMVAWRKAGLPEMTVAANLSAVQFKRGNLANSVLSALSQSGLDAVLLELELTESILIEDTETTLLTIQRLKALGVKVSIDDFGTGYSSLAYLKRFAVDKLKIDRSFIRGIKTDASDAAIVRAIIQMARSLGLRTIGEGVEDEYTLELLAAGACDEAQGFHIAHPMSADEFSAFFTNGAYGSRDGANRSHFREDAPRPPHRELVRGIWTVR